jgi:hypothetical protein
MNNLYELGFPVERFSCDSKCNNYGQRLIQLSANIFIGNGRCGNDAYIGRNTYNKGNGSLIDYLLMSGILFPCITYFNVLQFYPILSDVHCALEFCFNLNIIPDCNVMDTSIKSKDDVCYRTVWSSNLSASYKQKFDSTTVSNLFDEFKDVCENRHFDVNVVNHLTGKVSGI